MIAHQIPSVDFITKAKPKNQVRQKVEEYLEQLRQIVTKEDLELKRRNMQNYIGGLVHIRTMFLLVEKEVKTGSKSLYPNTMEARVRF